MGKILKDLFATYKGLVPEEKEEIPKINTNRWNVVSGLMDQLPYKKEEFNIQNGLADGSGIEESNSKSVYTPTIQENASYLDFIHKINQKLQGVITPNTELDNSNNSELITYLKGPEGKEQKYILYGLTKSVKDIINQNSQGYQEFMQHLRRYAHKHNLSSDDQNLLIGIAALESNFNPKIGNSVSSASGWFQFVDGTRKKYTNASRENFLNNSQLQIDVAYKHLQDVKNTLRSYAQKYKTPRNLTLFQAVRGMWFRPESLKSYLQNGRDISNSGKEYSDGQGTTLQKVLDRAK